MAFSFHVRGKPPVPAGKVVCIGKNYADHVREMAGTLWSGGEGDRSPPSDPVLFLKPATSLVADGGRIVLPRGVGEVHHEVEMIVLLGERAKAVAPGDALAHVAGYGVGIDVTARDLQVAAKKAGLPWTLAKGMDTFAPVSRIIPASEVPDPHDLNLTLRVNDELRQSGSTRQMIHAVPRLVSYASRHMTLEAGDLLMTGTPAGVGPLRPGDVCEARLGEVATLRVEVVEEAP